MQNLVISCILILYVNILHCRTDRVIQRVNPQKN